MKNLKQLLLLLMVALGLATSCKDDDVVCPSLMAPTVDKTTIAVGEELLINYSSTMLNGFTYEITEGDSFVEVLEKDSMHYIKGLAEGVATIMATNGGGTNELVITVGDLPSLETDLVLVGDSIRILNASNDLGFTYNITAGSENISVLDNDSVFYILGTKGGTAVITLSNVFGEVEDSVYISNVYLKDGYYVDHQGVKYNIDGTTGDASVAGANLGAGPNYDVDFSAINGEVTIWANLYYEKEAFPVVSIEEAAFYGSSADSNTTLTSLSFEENSHVQSIGTVTAANCLNLTKVDLSNCTELIEIKHGAFVGCENLQEVDFSGCTALETIDVTAFSGLEKLTALDFSNCTSLKYIGKQAFMNAAIIPSLDFTNCTALETIGQEAFHGCSELKTVIFPASLTTLDFGVFFECTALESVDFSSCTELTSIPSSAFYFCESLKTVDLSACTSLTSIGTIAFVSNTALTSVQFPASLTTIVNNAFANCSNLANVDLSVCTGLDFVEYKAFKDCNAAVPITLPGTAAEWSPSNIIDDTNWNETFTR